MHYYEILWRLKKTEFTVKDVQKYLKVDHLIVLPQHIIREIMKKELRLTFKKWLSHPNNVDFDRLKVLRWMFSVKFATILKDNPLICNIDEWTITRTTKVNYSWSLRGMNKEIKNSPFARSIYLILAILSNGWWFLLVWHHTINSTIFAHFLYKLNSWINQNEMFGWNELVYIMDNCSSHKSKLTKHEIDHLKMRIYYIPIYSPTFAPIEIWFAFIKKKLANISRSKNIKLNSKESQNKLLTVMKSISKDQIMKYFSKFYQEIKLN